MFSLWISFNDQRGYFQYFRHFHACCNVTTAINMAQSSKTKTEKTLQRKQLWWSSGFIRRTDILGPRTVCVSFWTYRRTLINIRSGLILSARRAIWIIREVKLLCIVRKCTEGTQSFPLLGDCWSNVINTLMNEDVLFRPPAYHSLLIRM